MRTLFPFLASLSVVAAVLAFTDAARADCALPRSYTTHVQGSSVTVCPTNADPSHAPGCPVPGGMLRLDTRTGEVVKLPDVCGAGTGAGADCYLDECVPPGTYQYGYGTPYECCPGCCGTMLASADVTVAASGACSPGDAGAPTAADAAPWTPSNPKLCDYRPGPGPGGGDAGADSGANGAPGDAGGSSGGGCSLSRFPSAEHSVLAIDGLAALVGLTLLARRRRAARR